MPTVIEVKKALTTAGFELYRTRGREICLADRVRDNLIMESGVSVVCAEASLAVRLVVRAQRSDFPNEGATAMFERARHLGEPAEQRGFKEVGTMTNTLHDPTDASRTLDIWYEVAFEKPVRSLEDVVDEVRALLAYEKTVRSEASAT